MTPKIKLVAVVAVALAVMLGCATLAPGSDPIVVNTERVLRAADGIYAEAMAYLPGLALASRIRSATLLPGNEGCATST